MQIMKPCVHPGCRALVPSPGPSRCAKHAAQAVEERRARDRRPSAAKQGYDRRWASYRVTFLRANPFCVVCRCAGKLEPAIVVDHIDPHLGDMGKFWDVANHQPLCARCHAVKTGRERRARVGGRAK
jgi:5-methylcytosine-specific restriction protein A